MQLQTTSPESKFPNKYTDAIFIQIDRHLTKLVPKYKEVPILWNTVYILYLRKYSTHWAKRFTEKWKNRTWHVPL